MERVISEAEKAFGDGSVFVEKFIENPKHIEIQVLFDQHGKGIHLVERDCSIQRRHQKVIEEAPSTVLTPELRAEMGEKALNVGRSCNYVGAGTVEFLYENGSYYFLEMNTRLQVEHPITEMITGVDLAEWQIKIAEGQALTLNQEDIQANGHAIELRVYAEDPDNQFLPSIGTLEEYIKPTGEGIRVDDGFEKGMEVPIYYDPMIAKLAAHGENRKVAISKLLNAISNYKIEGIKTTLPFGEFVLNHEVFKGGNYTTKFVPRYFYTHEETNNHSEVDEAVASIALEAYLKAVDLL
jgi:propionyl-CoA carboxylase alpha chain